MTYIEKVLAELNQSTEEYIEDCRLCFLNELDSIQQELQEATTDELLDELKNHYWSSIFRDYCKAIKYELMLRMDFKEEL